MKKIESELEYIENKLLIFKKKAEEKNPDLMIYGEKMKSKILDAVFQFEDIKKSAIRKLTTCNTEYNDYLNS